MEIKIRKAALGDCARMMELITELAVYEKAPEEVTVTMDHFIESGFGHNPVWWAYVAEVTNEKNETSIAGFALYYIRYSTWKGQRLYLEDILVTEDMRGKGIGRLLFDKLLDVCKENRYTGMVWQVLDWNEPAINFYKKYQDVAFDAAWINCSIEPK